MGAFVAQLGADLHLGRLGGLSAQSGMLIDGCSLAATLSQPRSPWRIASPSSTKTRKSTTRSRREAL